MKKAIDYIRFLLNQNSRLKAELNTIKLKGKFKVSDINVGCDSPPYSDTSSPEHSPDNSLPPSPDSKWDKDEVRQKFIFISYLYSTYIYYSRTGEAT